MWGAVQSVGQQGAIRMADLAANRALNWPHTEKSDSQGCYLEIFGREPGLPGDLRKESRADFFVVMERKRVVRPPSTLEPPVRALLPSDIPSYSEQGSK
jgi:hypothetical protein